MKLSRTDWKYAVDTLMFLAFLGVVVIGVLMAFVIPEGPAEAGRSKYFLDLHRHQWGAIHLYLSLGFAGLVAVHLALSWSWVKGKAAGVFGKGWKAALGLTVPAALAVLFAFWLAAPKNDPAYAHFGEGRGRQAPGMSEAARPAAIPPPDAEPGALPGRVAAPAVGTAAAPPTEASAEPPAAEPAPSAAHEDKTVAGRMEAGTAEIVITGQMTLREIERATGVPASDIAARLGLPAGVATDTTIGRLRKSYGFEMQALRDAVAELLAARRRSPRD